MEATVSQSFWLTTLTNSDYTLPTLSNSMKLNTRLEKNKRVNILKCNHLRKIKPATEHRTSGFKASCTS